MSQPVRVDPRGARFNAGITAAVFVTVLLTLEPARPVALVLLAIQAVVFGVGAFHDLNASPYSHLFRVAVRPRLGEPKEWEESAPLAFAQLLGFVFAVSSFTALALGWTVAAYVAAAFALIASLLLASIGLCLGCELYLILRRLSPARA